MRKVLVLLISLISVFCFSQVKLNDSICIIKNKAILIEYNFKKWDYLKTKNQETNEFPLYFKEIFNKRDNLFNKTSVSYAVDCYQLFPEDTIYSLDELKENLSIDSSFVKNLSYDEKPLENSMIKDFSLELKYKNKNVVKTETFLTSDNLLICLAKAPYLIINVYVYNYYRFKDFLYVERNSFNFPYVLDSFESVKKLYLSCSLNTDKKGLFRADSENNYYKNNGIDNLYELEEWYKEKKQISLKDKIDEVFKNEFSKINSFKEKVKFQFVK